MAGAGVGSGQDHDALTAARFQLGDHELKIANSIQNAQVAPDDDGIQANEADPGDEDVSSVLMGRLSPTSEMTELGGAADRLAAVEDFDLAEDLEGPEL